MRRAPVHVLPEPGGPCTNRWPPSSRRASAFISSRSGGLDPRARRHPLDAWVRSAQDGLERSVAIIAGQDRPGDPQHRATLLPIVVGPTGNQGAGQRNRGEARAALEAERPRGVVDLENLARSLTGRRIHDRSAPELVVLRRKPEGVDPVTWLRRHGRAARVGLELADRLEVLDELLRGHPDALEVPPPRRPRLAPVVLQQLAGQPARRPGLGAGRSSSSRSRCRSSCASTVSSDGVLGSGGAGPGAAPAGRTRCSQSRSARVARQSSSL